MSSFKTTTTSTGEEKLRVHLEQQKCTSDQPDDVGPPSLPEDRFVTTPDGWKELIHASMMFTAFELLHDHPLVVYADFETYQAKADEAGVVSRMTGVASYAYKIVSKVPLIPSALVLKVGSAEDFVEEMVEIGETYRKALKWYL